MLKTRSGREDVVPRARFMFMFPPLPSPCLVLLVVLALHGWVVSSADAFEVTASIGQVTPSGSCAQHRNGVQFAVRKINELNGGKGFLIGYGQSDYVKFKDDTDTVDSDAFTGSAYEVEHRRVLQTMVGTVDFFVGSCSHKSELEKDIANDGQKILSALVGPNAYYEDKLDYIFGMHISSYTYTEPSFKSAAFQGAKTVAIAGRKQSLFFQTTCAQGEEYAKQYGMTLAMPRVEYEASGDTSQVKNETYQRSLAKQMCESGADIYAGCVGFDEAKVWMQVWEEMNCKPKAVWLTCMTWGWKNGMGDHVSNGEYLLGAGQWHSAMTYSDNVVGNAATFAKEFEPIYGYEPNYDAVAAYTAVFIYMKAIQKAFRGQTLVSGTNLISNNYEAIRRTLSFLIERDTLYGPVEFDLEFKRNIGRQPANMQFLGSYSDGNDQMVDYCVAPSGVANSNLKYPAPNSAPCGAGTRYVSNSELVPGFGEKRCFLCNKCLNCGNKYVADVGSCDFDGKRPVSYQWSSQHAYRCDTALQLPSNKTIDCEYVPVDSGIALGVIIIDAFGMFFTFCCILFIFVKSKEQVIKRSQPFFMIAFLLGALICNAASIPFLGPADNANCALQPLLISTGAALMLSALIVKMQRIKKIITMAEKLVAKAVTVKDLLPVMVSFCAIALGIWIGKDSILSLSSSPPPSLFLSISMSTAAMPFTHSLLWFSSVWVCIDAPERTAYLKTIDPFNVATLYKCSTTSVFETLLIFYCGGLLLYSCVLAYQIRQMPDDLQETKALLFSAYTVFLFAAFGIPLLFLIGDTMLRVLLMSFFINIPVIVTVASLCIPKFLSVMGIKWQSEVPSAVASLQATYATKTNQVVPTSGTVNTTHTVNTTTTVDH